MGYPITASMALKPKKILHIIKSMGRGGAETLLPETLKLHDQRQFEFHYVYFLPWKNQMVEALECHGGRVTCIPASNNARIMLKVGEVVRYIREHDIELIHCHLPWAGMVGRLVHRSTGLPVLYTEHNKQERYHLLTRWMNKLTFNGQSLAIAVSNDVAESIVKNIHPAIPVRTILNGVNTDFFQRDRAAGLQIKKQLGIPEEAFVVGTVAVFRFQKRLKEWLDVFAKASQSNPNLYGILVGDGPLKSELESYRAQLGLVDKVIMPGLQTEVKPYYSAMDIFMMTSVFEGLPIALLEAMSMGCVIATTDAGGIKEVIRNESEGVIVPVDQWQTLPEKIINLGQQPSRRSQLSLAARARVIESFSLQRMVNELEQVYSNPPQ